MHNGTEMLKDMFEGSQGNIWESQRKGVTLIYVLEKIYEASTFYVIEYNINETFQ